jgi:hypothetical protein
LIKELSENEIAIFSVCEVFFPRAMKHLQIALAFQSSMHGCSVVNPVGINAGVADLVCGSRIGFHGKTRRRGDRAMSARTFMSTMAAALMLVGSVAAASAAEPRVHQTTRVHAAATEVVSAPVTQIDQDGNYVINHNQGAIPASPY